MFSVFNPFRDRTSEHTAERLIDGLGPEKCDQIVRDLDRAENYDPRVCPIMSKTNGTFPGVATGPGIG
jgi:hypothetical protein